MGKTFFKKVTLERVIVFNNIAFPLKERCLLGGGVFDFLFLVCTCSKYSYWFLAGYS